MTQPQQPNFKAKCVNKLPEEGFQTLEQFVSHNIQYDHLNKKLSYPEQVNYARPFAFRINNVLLANNRHNGGLPYSYVQINDSNFQLLALKLNNSLLFNFDREHFSNFNTLQTNRYKITPFLDKDEAFMYKGNAIFEITFGQIRVPQIHFNKYCIRLRVVLFQKTHVYENGHFNLILPTPPTQQEQLDLLAERVNELHIKFDSFLDAVNTLQEIKSQESEDVSD